MRAIAYLRVSTDEQAATGLGLEAQLKACRTAAERIDLEVAKVYQDDGVSGAASLDKRKGLLAAIDALEPGDVLVVAKRDRLARGDVILTAMIERLISRRKARLVSAAGEGTDGNDPSDILMRRMVDAFAEYERLLISARTRAALQAKRDRGEACRFPRYGERFEEDRIVVDTSEAKVIAAMQEMQVSGMSFRAIARSLNETGIPTKYGVGAWHHKVVGGILRRDPEANV